MSQTKSWEQARIRLRGCKALGRGAARPSCCLAGEKEWRREGAASSWLFYPILSGLSIPCREMELKRNSPCWLTVPEARDGRGAGSQCRGEVGEGSVNPTPGHSWICLCHHLSGGSEAGGRARARSLALCSSEAGEVAWYKLEPALPWGLSDQPLVVGQRAGRE